MGSRAGSTAPDPDLVRPRAKLEGVVIKPKERLASVLELTPEWLRSRELSGVIADLDNTLLPYGEEGAPPTQVLQWLESLRGEGIPVYLVTNAGPLRTNRWAAKLDIPAVGMAAKPLPFAYHRAIRGMGLMPGRVAVVGDQLFTDILGGNWVGAYTVLVSPISDSELLYTRIVRRLERTFLREP